MILCCWAQLKDFMEDLLEKDQSRTIHADNLHTLAEFYKLVHHMTTF